MRRLIVVSNRVAPIDEGKPSAGGLAVGVLAALKQTGGIWFGWSGKTSDQPATKPKMVSVGRLAYATVDLTPRDYDEYYNGFANRVLWPLFHYRLDLTSFDRREYAGYLRVNALFASTLRPMLDGDESIWVHDYHLIPLGEELRHAGFAVRIGFFLHTPFPACEVIEALPNHEHLVRSLCAYDVVGFQTKRDLRGFVQYIRHIAKGSVGEDGTVRAFGRRLRALALPIGVDVDNIVRTAEGTLDTPPTRRLRESLGERDLIIGVDRLDYSKGLVRRFDAFERLLERYPTYRNSATFMQIAPPTRSEVPEYAEIRRELEETAGRVNGRFAEFDWVPIRYLNRSVNRRTLIGFLRLARVGLVTPLRDGMNLVAKEYVAAQDPDDPGVLVLSEFAGAAAQLPQALIVNPYDVDEIAEAIARGLSLSRAERVKSWRLMMDTVTASDINDWRERFLAELDAVPVAA